MTDKILAHLKIKKSKATLEYLQQLIIAYCSNVPWESVSKNIKKNSDSTNNCSRLSEEFWISVFQYGTGGTCYESNWAFFNLLKALNFEGYLTINKVIDKSSVHSAIVIKIKDKKYIVDIGYPTYTPIEFSTSGIIDTMGNQILYRSTAVSEFEYIIENFPHPKPYLYNFIDIAVNPEDYFKIVNDDYGDAGLFSDRIIIRKIIDKLPTRFDSEDKPYNIQVFVNGNKSKVFIDAENLLSILSIYYNIDINLLSQSFDMLRKDYSRTNRQRELPEGLCK